MTLNEWIRKSITRPHAIIAISLFVAWLVFAVRSYYSIEAKHHASVEQIATLLSIPVQQQNRVMAESLLETLVSQGGAKSVEICKEGVQQVGVNKKFKDCQSQADFFERVIEKNINGSSTLVLRSTFSIWTDLIPILSTLGLAFLLVLSTFFLVQLVQKKIQNDLLAPLRNNFLSLVLLKIRELNSLRDFLRESQEKELRHQKTQDELTAQISTWMSLCEEKDLVCRQIYHDIASPLGLLKVSTQKLEDQNIAKPFALTLDRLVKISEDLKTQKYIWASENPKVESLKTTLDAILQEKRLLTSHMNIRYIVSAKESTTTQIPDIPVGQFHRVLSNILNNAIEAIQPSGIIRILARHSLKNKTLDLIISDNGQGIPREVAPHVFDKQKSFGKQSSGLGLYHAKTCIESFGGQLMLLNTSRSRNHGAAFLIRLPTQ